MRTKNSRPIDALEAAWLADVKRQCCAFCNGPPPCEAHHITGGQGLHFGGVAAACERCHDGHVWRVGGVTELEAVNETIRRVLYFRAGLLVVAGPLRRSRERKRGRPDKILERKI